MKQLDLFDNDNASIEAVGFGTSDPLYGAVPPQKTMNWPNDFDGAHQVGGVEAGICRAAPDGRNILVDPPKKIYESPDKGKTVYEREFGAHPSTRTLIKTSVQQQWNITFNGEKVTL